MPGIQAEAAAASKEESKEESADQQALARTKAAADKGVQQSPFSLRPPRHEVELARAEKKQKAKDKKQNAKEEAAAFHEAWEQQAREQLAAG